MRKPTVCISHATGAGGEEVGRAVAERLGLRYVDDEVIGEAAEWAELDPRHAAERTAPTRLPPGYAVRTPPTDEDLRGLITDVLRSFGAQGGVVIVAHAASFALAGGEVLRVLVTASPGTRAARADYLRRFYGVEREEPVHFDLVVNTDALEPARAAELVAAAAAAR